jgi:NADH-quinone oxidoreductase subunit C
MNKTQLTDYIRNLLPETIVSEGKQFAEVVIPSGLLHESALKLKANLELNLDFLECISGVDYGKDLGVVYHLTSSAHKHTIVLKVRIQERDNPVVDSVSDIWLTADFQEREVYDLLGIKFRGHPDLRRLFLDNSWGFPLRKDYSDEINIVTK